MFAPKQASPEAKAAIQVFLSSGGQITKVPTHAHGTCEKRKGIKFGGKDPEKVRAETFSAAEKAQKRREWINRHGGLKLVHELGGKAPWEEGQETPTQYDELASSVAAEVTTERKVG